MLQSAILQKASVKMRQSSGNQACLALGKISASAHAHRCETLTSAYGETLSVM